MAFSKGESFFKDLLDYSDKHSHDKELKTTYALQARAADFFKNNQYPTLNKSQEYSGMISNNGEKDPLGGPINKLVSGTNNLPGTGICGDEFDFWGKNPVPSHKNEDEQNVIIENYNSLDGLNNLYSPNSKKENFTENYGNGDSNGTLLTIIIITIILLLIGGGLYLYNKNK